MAEGSEFKLPVPLSKLSDEVEHTDELRQKHYQPAYLQRTHQLHPEKSVKHFGRGIYELLRVEYNEQNSVEAQDLERSNAK
jgi:hypothetical protein